MTIEEQLARLNKTIWRVMTHPDVNNQSVNLNIIGLLDLLREDGYIIMVGAKEHNYTIGELRVIEKIIAWATQIAYAEDKIEMENAIYEDDADTEMYDQLVKEAKEGLMIYRKLHPDSIPFFIKTDWNKITLKNCPYWLFKELLLYKTGFLTRRFEGPH
jgi:hypothetical protein